MLARSSNHMRHFWTSRRAGHSDELDTVAVPVLEALRCAPVCGELDGEAAAVAQIITAMTAAEAVPVTRRSVVRPSSRLSLTIAVATGALALTSGLAFAGELPGAAQDTAHNMLATLGVSVPGPNSHAGTHPDVRGNSSTVAASNQTPTGAPSTESAKGKGKVISALAHSTTATGRDKGATISTAASGGKSHAGTPPGQSGSANQHGSSTSGAASGGKSHAGNPPGQSGTTHQHAANPPTPPAHPTPPTKNGGHGASTSGTASAGHSHAGANN
jgi:hypothetical protein